MWANERDFPARGFSTPPPPPWKSRPSKMWQSERKPKSWTAASSGDLFHVIHKVPAGDSPYVKAKHAQLIDKDPSRAVCLFWAAINSGDRVDSALKDMAVVMKQLDRSDEAVEAIKSFRHLCSSESQESLDNLLVELYKRSGRLEEEINVLQDKLKRLEEGSAFGGRKVKMARSQGRRIFMTVEQEYARLLGNLAWAYMQQNDYKSAEEHYRKALSIEPDKNKQCNLAVCLMQMNKLTEAKFLLQAIRSSSPNGIIDETYAKSFERASETLAELESQVVRFQSRTGTKMSTYTPVVSSQRSLDSPVTQPKRRSVHRDESFHRLPCKLQFENPSDQSVPTRDHQGSYWTDQQSVHMHTDRSTDSTLKANENLEPRCDCSPSLAETSRTDTCEGGNMDQKQWNLYINKSNKCWADMADEDEELFIDDILGENRLYPSDEPFPSSQPSKLFDSWKDNKESLEENRDKNINAPSPQAENLRKKIESFSLSDNSHAVGSTPMSGKNQTVRRSLFSAPHEQQKRSSIKCKWTGRLKAFQDITGLRDSPRA